MLLIIQIEAEDNLKTVGDLVVTLKSKQIISILLEGVGGDRSLLFSNSLKFK